VDLATVDAAVVVAVTVVVAVDAAAVEVVAGAARKRASGFPSPSWDVSSRTRRSGPWKRSISSLSLSKRPRLYSFLGPELKDEVLKIMPVQKQTRAGQRTRFKAFVAIGDYNGHVGLGVKCSKEVATAIRGAIILAKLSILPVRRGFWGNKIGKPHTVPCKVTGKCGSIWVRLIPAPRGTGIVSAPVPKKLLQMAGIEDCYTSARGSTGTLGNFAKATYAAIAKTYAYLTPDLWKDTVFSKSPYQEFSDHLAKSHKPVSAQKQEVKQY